MPPKKSISQLHVERGVSKATLTKIEQFLDKNAESATASVLEMRLESLARANSNFADVQNQIYALIDPENALDILAEQDEVMDFNERVVNAEFRIKTLLKSFKTEPTASQATNNDDQISKLVTVIADALSKREKSHSKKAKLPDLDIPKFSGDYTEWQSFRDLYVCSVHDNDELSNVQKFQYLRGLIEGQARGSIKHLPMTDGNYEKAWDAIVKRFNKEQCVLFAHIDMFFGQPKVPDNNPILLRNLLNTSLETINAVETLGYKDRDIWLINYILRKVDNETHSLWTREFPQSRVPSWDEFLEFLEKRCDSVEASTSKNNGSNREKQNGNSKGAKSSKSSKTALAISVKNCQMCHQGAHYSYQCQKFQSGTPAQRLQLVKKAKLCLNCLRDSHTTEACQGSSCRKCQVKHNTLLHDALVAPSENSQAPTEAPVNPVPSSSGGVPASLVSNLQRKVISEQILLPTATIIVKGGDGRLHKCRALLDSCSQTNFVTNSFVQKSKLRTLPQGNHVVSGIGQHKTSTNNSTHFSFSSQDGNFTMDLDFIVLDSIVDDQPSSTFEVLWQIPAGIPLADFEYNIRSRIDVLLGAEVFMKALRSGRFEGSPTLQETAFGYIIAGSTPCESTSALASSCVSTCLCSLNMSDTLHQQMERFWMLEEPPIPEKILSKEEQLCETHFMQHTTRESDGRFVVRLPLRDNLEALGKSETLALKRFFCIEKKLQRNSDLREKYVAFMREYESLGHMRLLPETYHSDRPPVYLPHHPVFKVSSSTPVRVVFDASAKTSSGVSLNDVLMVGPKTQDDLFAILLRFREHNIVVKADIKKMFRQVRVHSDDQNMQRIFWREAPHLPMNTYLLSTVTYGTGSASYLSTRCISKLVEEEGDNFPVAKPAASRDFYVDDFISGSRTVAEAQELQSQINLLMLRGGFQLSKWMSNSSEALKNVPLSEREITEPLDLSSTETISTLGLQWNPVSDEFTFKVSSSSQTITKRAILSEMSRIFDPLGLLAPVTIQAKILMQSLWLVKANWDDELVDTTVLQTWQEYQQNLKDLMEFRIPRHITSAYQPQLIQLSVFCDASEKAFGTCIYLQAIDPVSGNQLTSRLLCAKTRVAPLKQVSLPRLELCAALLAMKLLQSVLFALTVRVDSIAAFTDSTIVLYWLSSEPKRWQTFVANRVSKIQNILPRENWFHVPSALNPADLTSRGLSPSKLKDNILWWSGPNTKELQEKREIPSVQVSEAKLEQKVVCAVTSRNSFWTIINKFSSHSKMIRSLSIWRRYFHNLRSRIHGKDIICGPLTSQELTDTNMQVIRAVQAECFADDIRRLKGKQKLSNTSRIKDLCPYMDELDILRVGGRIENAQISSSQKHPAILPNKHTFSRLIADKVHRETCHGGPQLMLYTIRQEYWPLRGLDVAKAARRKCVRCFRCQPQPMQQIMGNLPPYRLRFTRAFDKVGVDLCGYFLIKTPLKRNASVKMYVTVFVCMITHAIHLELVTDLSTNAFLAAFRRFIARRGRPTDVYCDNAKNFVGAQKQLEEIRQVLSTQTSQEIIAKHAADARINFHFIPPRSAHFGGMWESSVKSFKRHFYRIVGNTPMTQESMLTVLAEIEMCLNSRPLSPISSSPEDFAALTPGHFITGAPLNALPQHDITALPENRLDKWQRNQQIVQHFWRRFRIEVFSQLQQRKKWQHEQPDLKVNDLVVILEDNVPPLSWILGRIIDVHPGRDRHVRVAKVKTQTGIYTRAITRLARLPDEVQNQEVLPGENGDEAP